VLVRINPGDSRWSLPRVATRGGNDSDEKSKSKITNFGLNVFNFGFDTLNLSAENSQIAEKPLLFRLNLL